MNAKNLLLHFVLVFAVTFVVSSLVIYLTNRFFFSWEGFEWQRSFTFAITLGIALPLIEAFRKKG